MSYRSPWYPIRCDPVAIRRVWGAPGTPLSITRDGDSVVLRYEWMDVKRVVQLNATTHPKNGPRTSLGHSIGHFEGDSRPIAPRASLKTFVTTRTASSCSRSE